MMLCYFCFVVMVTALFLASDFSYFWEPLRRFFVLRLASCRKDDSWYVERRQYEQPGSAKSSTKSSRRSSSRRSTTSIILTW